jgi:hypothetical protein
METMEVVMKRLLTFAILSLTVLALIGCDEDNSVRVVESIPPEIPPQVPQGVYSVTGDGMVTIYWLPIDDINGDFSHYAVYRSNDAISNYLLIGETTSEVFVDHNVVNGQKYYYAVSSVDVDGYLSDLSYEDVFDTPRPEGFGQVLYDYLTTPTQAGWDLSRALIVPYDDASTDFYFEYLPGDGVFYINVANVNTDLQDMGYTADWDEIGYASEDGWSLNGWAEIIKDHTYLIWTDDNHYAKIRINSIVVDANPRVYFDWAYQTAPGSPELKIVAKRPAGYLRHPEGSN